MTARRVVTAEHEGAVSGALCARRQHRGRRPRRRCRLRRLGDAAHPLRVLRNDAQLRKRDGVWTVEGDPMEGALIALAMKAGLNAEHVPSGRAWMKCPSTRRTASWRLCTAAPTDRRCFRQGRAGGAAGALRHARRPGVALENRAASAGERVLGFAFKRMHFETRAIVRGMSDSSNSLASSASSTPRPEAVDAIAQCRRAGIAVKMITGDHAATAAAIAAQLGLERGERVLTGAELDALEESFAEQVRRTSVFARTAPEHKLRIVRALQAGGAVVAMTGDGVNDAPSLKQADVGVDGNQGHRGGEGGRRDGAARRQLRLDRRRRARDASCTTTSARSSPGLCPRTAARRSR